MPSALSRWRQSLASQKAVSIGTLRIGRLCSTPFCNDGNGSPPMLSLMKPSRLAKVPKSACEPSLKSFCKRMVGWKWRYGRGRLPMPMLQRRCAQSTSADWAMSRRYFARSDCARAKRRHGRASHTMLCSANIPEARPSRASARPENLMPSSACSRASRVDQEPESHALPVNRHRACWFGAYFGNGITKPSCAIWASVSTS